MNVVAVDVGTSSLRATVFDDRGDTLFLASSSYQPRFPGGDRAEQDPSDWERSLFDTLRDVGVFLREQGLSADALSVTSQRASVIPVGRDGRPLADAIMWQDKRSIDACAWIAQRIPVEDLYRRTGLRLDPYFSAPKMIWLREHEPECYRAADRLLGVQDYVILLLTGRAASDATQASRTLLMGIEDFRWDDELLRDLEIDRRLLPEIVPPGSVVAGLSREASGRTGLPAGLRVIAAGGDQQCAALALGILAPGSAEANTGTGSFVIAHAERPALDPQRRTLCSASALPGAWVVEAGILTSGIVFSWLGGILGGEEAAANGANVVGDIPAGGSNRAGEGGREALLVRLGREAEASPPGANGVFLQPHFKGSAAPYWDPSARGVFWGLTLGTNRGDLARAVLEGIALELAENLALVESVAGPVREVTVAGGMSRLELFDRIQADAFERPVLRYENPEASSLGALISASVTLGRFRDYGEARKALLREEPERFLPDPGRSETYARLREEKGRLYEALREFGRSVR